MPCTASTPRDADSTLLGEHTQYRYRRLFRHAESAPDLVRLVPPVSQRQAKTASSISLHHSSMGNVPPRVRPAPARAPRVRIIRRWEAAKSARPSFADSIPRSSSVRGTVVRTCVRAPEIVVQELPVLLRDRLEIVGSTAPSHEGDEVAGEFSEARSLGDLRRHHPLRHRRNPRPGEEIAQVQVLSNMASLSSRPTSWGLVALLFSRGCEPPWVGPANSVPPK
jgi:hypothetical protein